MLELTQWIQEKCVFFSIIVHRIIESSFLHSTNESQWYEERCWNLVEMLKLGSEALGTTVMKFSFSNLPLFITSNWVLIKTSTVINNDSKIFQFRRCWYLNMILYFSKSKECYSCEEYRQREKYIGIGFRVWYEYWKEFRRYCSRI